MTQLAVVGRVLPQGIIFVVVPGTRFNGALVDWITVDEYQEIIDASRTAKNPVATGCTDREVREVYDNEETRLF